MRDGGHGVRQQRTHQRSSEAISGRYLREVMRDGGHEVRQQEGVCQDEARIVRSLLAPGAHQVEAACGADAHADVHDEVRAPHLHGLE